MGYDEVGVEESIDLIKMLPDGSKFISKHFPERSWSQLQNLFADVEDTLIRLLTHNSENHVIRPPEQVAMNKARIKVKKARSQIESNEWEEV